MASASGSVEALPAKRDMKGYIYPVWLQPRPPGCALRRLPCRVLEMLWDGLTASVTVVFSAH